MNWEPLEPSRLRAISQEIQYKGKGTGTEELYQRVAALSCSLEDKVKFILRHWGWDGTVRIEGSFVMSKIGRAGLTIPMQLEPFFEQLYGLCLPRKTRSDKTPYGGTVRFWYQDIIDYEDFYIPSECLSVRFDDDILPIGCLLEYGGYPENRPNGWEDPHYACRGCCCSDLFLGSSGRIYLWNMEVSDDISIEAEDLLTFLAVSFGLIEAPEVYGGIAADEDIELIERIEELVRAGKYRPNEFRIKRYEAGRS